MSYAGFKRTNPAILRSASAGHLTAGTAPRPRRPRTGIPTPRSISATLIQRIPRGWFWVIASSDSHAEGPALRATLFLEDGSRFDGAGFGASTRRAGEVVFTTGMVGYPESLTDPSYRGQILTFTYPLLGNYGIPDPAARDRWGLPAHLESPHVQTRGVVVRGLTDPSHWAATRRLESWLADEGVPGIAGIDTRRLTQHLRSAGVLRGVIDVRSGDEPAVPGEQLARQLRDAPRYDAEPLVEEVSPASAAILGDRTWPLVAVLDCGVKTSILRNLLDRRLSVLRLPFDATVPSDVGGRPVVGLLVGNGPGDPATLAATVDELRRPSTRALPTLGICLGHQLLALSRGGSTFKLKYGHRGQNKTVGFADGTALIVSENHGYAVDPMSLSGTGLRTWATNPDDGTLEGMRDTTGRLLALQGHPEGHPGPQEAGFVFDRFAQKLRRRAS
ncbi:MAG: glutamine-hydrolyzing carbamoyl-phosphate synthase small subunit [Thermoplasmata archaeon]|nr:glutamine-hydrolyzing carbamoyl-phosphate synthase small subunit [Thermoplasmata archaeon]